MGNGPDWAADVPLGLERIIFRALEKNPAYRFRSMQEMADALLDLRLYLEEQGYFQSEAVLTASEKGYVPAHHLIHHHAQRIDIRLKIHMFAPRLLR